tara:strand:- start:1540 stop:1743 length:204 start_codon:yes stop_codon:yes gene_type:complete
MENINNQTHDQPTKLIPVFEEIDNMDMNAALNVLMQAAAAAQGAGCLNIRDSVLLAKAIEVIKPGSI